MRVLQGYLLLIVLSVLPGCGGGGGTGCGPNPQFGLFCCPSCADSVPKTCSELVASNPLMFWSLSGFGPQDILNPDVRNQTELTAIMHVGDVKTLRVRAATTLTTEDCSGKAASAEWSVSNPVVARLDIVEGPRTRSLVALQPGDTVVAATLTFQDGTPPMRVLPWSFTNVGSGDITVVRVVR